MAVAELTPREKQRLNDNINDILDALFPPMQVSVRAVDRDSREGRVVKYPSSDPWEVVLERTDGSERQYDRYMWRYEATKAGELLAEVLECDLEVEEL